MRLLIDSVTVGSPGGIQLQRELAWAAARTRSGTDEVILLLSEDSHEVAPSPGLQIKSIPSRGGGFKNRWTWYNRDLPNLLAREKIDVLFAHSSIITSAQLKVAGVVTTINNMLPFTPPMLRQYPLLSKPRLKFRVLRHLYVKSAKLADSLVLHSHHAMERITHAGVDITSKTTVVLTGVPSSLKFDPMDPPPHPRNGRPYFFYLSSMQRYKNHINLLEGYRLAYQKLGEALPDLVLAGISFDLPYVHSVMDAIQQSGLEKKITYLSDPPREQIPALIHHAYANYFPSLCETNSVIQAEIVGMHGIMACSDIPPMPEIGGDAALLFDPLDPQAIAESMIKLSTQENLRNELRERSKKRATELSWDDCGRAMWKMAALAQEKFRRRNA